MNEISSLIKRQFFVTHWYTVLQETKLHWFAVDQNLSMLYFLRKYKDKQFFVDTFSQGVFVTQLSSNAEISV
jgi:hypothetical protein